jgi:hypothetical protein
MNRSKIGILILLVFSTTFILKAEDDIKNEFNPLTVGVPSLTIAPDARGGGMGDIGAATEPDMASQYWNPAKNAFAYSKAGVSLSYTPWLRSLVDDIDLVYLSGFYKIGEDNHVIGASLRYFSLGDITITRSAEDVGYKTRPYELAADIGYSLKLTDVFSLGVTFRYIYSDLGAGAAENDDFYPGSAFAGDIAGYYHNYVMLGSNECLWGLGFNISNIGTKISYDDGNTSLFIPTNLRLGTSLLFPMDDYNTLSLSLDLNKYLIPTPPDVDKIGRDIIAKGGSSADATAAQDAARNDYNSISSMAGMFKSFGDAPGGAKEEFQEITWSFGAEYAYDNKFFVRGGYFYESPNKGNRQYFSVGAGFKMSALQIDAAYLISTVPSNPLDQTLRFSLTFDMDGLKGLMR